MNQKTDPVKRERRALAGATGLEPAQIERLLRCGYAVNAELDEYRERRLAKAAPDSSYMDSEWAKFCTEAGKRHASGELASKCGRPSVLLVVHPVVGCLPYCVDHFIYDMGMANLALAILRREAFSQADADMLEEHCIPRSMAWASVLEFCWAMEIMRGKLAQQIWKGWED